MDDIATYDLAACDSDDDAAAVLAREELRPFDCIPVRRGGDVAGVLLRGEGHGGGRVSVLMRPLTEKLLVSSCAPLKSFLPLLLDQPHRLVVRGAKVEGIVSRSDAHKLPVRVLTFSLIAQLELAMSEAIRRTYGDASWLAALTANRRARVLEKRTALRETKSDPPLLDLTDFCDKREALAKAGVLATPSKTRAIRDFERIEELRNSVVHAAPLAATDNQFREFVALLSLIEEWIVRLAMYGGPWSAPSRRGSDVADSLGGG